MSHTSHSSGDEVPAPASAQRIRGGNCYDGSSDEDDAIDPPLSTPATGDRPARAWSRPSSRFSLGSSRLSALEGIAFDSSLLDEPAASSPSQPDREIGRLVTPAPADFAASSVWASAECLPPLERGRHSHARSFDCTVAEGNDDDDGRRRPSSNSRCFTTPAAGRRAYTFEELANRPRSNPRTRTPMRNESPMPQILNRDTVHDGDEDEEEAHGAAGSRSGTPSGSVTAAGGMGGRVTIRIGAGATVGTVASLRTRLPSTPERRRLNQQPRSSRQGPSKRKVRRWNNDRMVGVASELANAGNGARGERAAEAFLRGEAEVARYAMPNKPLNYRSEFARMTKNEGGKYTMVRDRFIRGEIAEMSKEPFRGRKETKVRCNEVPTQLGKIQPRLRAVLIRACSSRDRFSSKIVNAFESYLFGSLHGTGGAGEETESDGPTSILDEILFCAPKPRFAVAKKSDKNAARETRQRPVTEFLFSMSLPRGGFHRLLLHSVCQFHGLEVSSLTASVDGEHARVLCVTGRIRGGMSHLLDYISQDGLKEKSGAVEDVEDVLTQARRPAADSDASVKSVVGPFLALEVA